MTMSAALVTISHGRAMEGVVAVVVWDVSITEYHGAKVSKVEAGQSRYLITATNAVAWGHQLGLPSSSMLPNAGPSQPLLSMLAPSWDSPPLSPEVQPPAADQQWEAWQASHSMPSLATIAPSWDLPTSSLAVSPPPRLLPASAQIPQTAPSPMEHACMDEQLDGVAASKPQPILATSQQPSPWPTATNATTVTWVYKEFMMKGQLQHKYIGGIKHPVSPVACKESTAGKDSAIYTRFDDQ
ncbi:hypothetical protein F5J12DRAFT_781098 [Pisolithus orientalis]|uniref:uncharacterized protein n=1 Tax=Pisolithus orientalis TaxID=936130 RepID=UPI0022259305|nr:uncharacterized protein F5J12DRAFT_781098 [Pisolithus orientalis]KAI6015010.1 hypothetical protein F5J12DRAFT_781098 [Pisolithus orientalis]